MPKRFPGLDLTRGIAIILMILYHIAFDLHYFGFIELGFPAEFWVFAPAVIGSLFLLIVGISLSISFAKAKKKLSKKEIRRKYFLRGTKIFALGLLVTAATWIYPRDGFVQFGILHLIGLSIILAIPFLGRTRPALIGGLAAILTGLVLREMLFDFSWLLWLGFIPKGFYTLDYYPLLPWFGLVLIGLFVGKKIYPFGQRSMELKENTLTRFLSLLGRQSLIIYLVHQPIIVLVLFFVFGFP